MALRELSVEGRNLISQFQSWNLVSTKPIVTIKQRVRLVILPDS